MDPFTKSAGAVSHRAGTLLRGPAGSIARMRDGRVDPGARTVNVDRGAACVLAARDQTFKTLLAMVAT
jgi:hypothetical protein